ncbi:MAG: hypothetical protein QOJ64_2680 [Acidobacteriota bacterium]|jgi:hypothetical protein|nr:hypothetical protein [Acidobacteriota bacterium]
MGIMTQQRIGVYLLLAAALLIFCSKPVAEFYKYMYERMGDGSPSLRTLRIGNVITGAIIGTLGLLTVLDIIHFR